MSNQAMNRDEFEEQWCKIYGDSPEYVRSQRWPNNSYRDRRMEEAYTWYLFGRVDANMRSLAAMQKGLNR